MKYLIFSLLFTQQIMAQNFSEGTSNSDLRGQKEIFSIGWDISEYKLESNQTGQYKLYLYKSGKISESWKIDKERAENLDASFADKFIMMKYEMTEEYSDCKKGTKLRMHGEDQTICPEENEKQIIIKKFISDLESSFVKRLKNEV